MSAMSGLPIRALAYGLSARTTWLLLIGTSSSPASTPLARLICADAGCAASSAPTAAAQSAKRFKALAPITVPPKLDLVALGPAIDLHLLAGIDRRRDRRLDRSPA